MIDKEKNHLLTIMPQVGHRQWEGRICVIPNDTAS